MLRKRMPRTNVNIGSGTAVILAAGECLRFWPLNCQHKSLFKIMGKPLIFYLVKELQESGVGEIIIVQNPKRDMEKALAPFSFKNLKFVVQEKPLGTGDALLKAEKFIKHSFFLMNAERLDAKEYLEEMLAKAKKSNLVILAAPTKMPHLFGILKVKGDKVLDIVEKPKQGKAPSDLKNIGFYFLAKEIFASLKKVSPHPYSLIKAIVLYAKGKEAKMALTQKPALFLKFPWDLFRYEKYLFDRFLENKIAASAEISKSAKIEGKVQISENVRIQEGVKILGPCYIGADSMVGVNAVVSDYSNLENDVRIGSFTGLKNSLLREKVQIHSGLLSRSILDKNCQLGAGTVLAHERFDRAPVKTMVEGKKVSTGLKSFGAVLGENTKVGINCSLMPGVMIGKDCIIGPHSFVKENIEHGKLFYSKFKNFKK